MSDSALYKVTTERALAEGFRYCGGGAPSRVNGLEFESSALATQSRSRANGGKSRR